MLLSFIAMVWSVDSAPLNPELWTPFGLEAPQSRFTGEQFSRLSLKSLEELKTNLNEGNLLVKRLQDIISSEKGIFIQSSGLTHYHCEHYPDILKELQHILESTTLDTQELKKKVAGNFRTLLCRQLDCAVFQAEIEKKKAEATAREAVVAVLPAPSEAALPATTKQHVDPNAAQHTPMKHYPKRL